MGCDASCWRPRARNKEGELSLALGSGVFLLRFRNVFKSLQRGSFLLVSVKLSTLNEVVLLHVFLSMAEAVTNSDITTKCRLSLDQVFQRTNHHPKNNTQQKILLTPLSKKACLIHGIDPHVLQNREYASFAEPGLDPEIQTMRYEVYIHTRDKLFELASEERGKLMEQNKSMNSDTNMSISSSSTDAMNSTISYDTSNVSNQIEMEKRRLEKVARRQQKELLRMLVSADVQYDCFVYLILR